VHVCVFVCVCVCVCVCVNVCVCVCFVFVCVRVCVCEKYSADRIGASSQFQWRLLNGLKTSRTIASLFH